MKKFLIILGMLLAITLSLSSVVFAKTMVVPRIMVGASGEQVMTTITVANEASTSIDARVYVSIPEFGIRSPVQVLDKINTDKEAKTTMIMTMPEATPEYVRIYVSNGKDHRIKYIPFSWW